MPESASQTIARPYAKAAFAYAQEHHCIPTWSDFLHLTAGMVADEHVHRILTNPEVSADQVGQWIIDLCQGHIDEPQGNFIRLLAQYRRLTILPAIAAIFEIQCKEQEQIVAVEVVSALPFANSQREKLLQALRIRLQRKVIVNFRIDPSLLGGAIIRASDLVIDGSVRSKLERLRAALER